MPKPPGLSPLVRCLGGRYPDAAGAIQRGTSPGRSGRRGGGSDPASFKWLGREAFDRESVGVDAMRLRRDTRIVQSIARTGRFGAGVRAEFLERLNA